MLSGCGAVHKQDAVGELMGREAKLSLPEASSVP